MASSKTATPTIRRLIIHHLSDLHYEASTDGQKNEILIEYSGYLATLPKDRLPDLVVVTGDLTSSGKKVDLDTVANGLSIAFPMWKGRLHEHVYIVPGPHDVNWEGELSPGLATFYDSFKEFALPPLDGAPQGRSAAGVIVRDAPVAEAAAFVGYPLDTCYSPNDLQAQLKSEFTQYATKYEEFVERRGALSKRSRGVWAWLESIRKENGEKARNDALSNLRDRFLDLTEGAPPVALDSGRVKQKDIESFESWTKALALKHAESDTPKDPLKILITHHALAIEAEQGDATSASQDAIRSFQQIAKAARTAGFHLALHGHIHKPQVLSDLSILEGVDTQHPMRQIGAASFGETGLFNEITAQYREESGDQGIWRLELRLVNVRDTEVSKSSYVLLNPAESADTKVEEMTKAREVREEFEQRMRMAMRSYSEQVHRTQNEARAEKMNSDLLPEAMRPFEGMIRDTIFDGFHTRVRLILKNIEPFDRAPTLTEQYLTFAETDNTDPLLYPASIAAWSLVLGRTLCYPEVMDLRTTSLDHEWMLRSGKVHNLIKALQSLMKQGAESSSPRINAMNRYQSIHDSLRAIQENREAVITGEEMYQAPLDGAPQTEFPYFISVPYPMRPRTAVANQLPEIAVLEVGVRQMKHPNGPQLHVGAEPKAMANPFTSDRVDMLECLMDLIGLTLTTANALGKPDGKWDGRSKA